MTTEEYLCVISDLSAKVRDRDAMIAELRAESVPPRNSARKPVPTTGTGDAVVDRWLLDWAQERKELERSETELASLRAELSRQDAGAYRALDEIVKLRAERDQLRAELAAVKS